MRTFPVAAKAKRRGNGRTARSGFTLIYTLIIISAILVASSSISSILVKELRLSGYGKDSLIAYQAAEAGAECALRMVLSVETTATCNGQPVNANAFTVDFGPGGCASVTIADGPPAVISSRGYNTCQPGKIKVERGVRYTVE